MKDISKARVLDATCGSRMMWFNHENPDAIYVDCREVDAKLIWESKDGKDLRYLDIHPDVIADFTHLPFPDNTFYLCVFDPPHVKRIGKNAWLAQKYGRLHDDWEKMIHDGFHECIRVLKPNGTLIFKWSEIDFTVKQVLAAIGDEYKPLFGHPSGKVGKTIWMTFMKEDES